MGTRSGGRNNLNWLLANEKNSSIWCRLLKASHGRGHGWKGKCGSRGSFWKSWKRADRTRDRASRERAAPSAAAWQQSERYTQRPFTLDDARERLWKLIRECPFLDFQLLTKRPENIARMMPFGKWPNVWLGASIESLDVLPRIDQLLEAWEKIEVPVRFISGEPLLGPLDHRGMDHKHCGINGVIGGGESGGQARECGIDWCRGIVDQCKKAEVAVFVKQLGKNPTMQWRRKREQGEYRLLFTCTRRAAT